MFTKLSAFALVAFLADARRGGGHGGGGHGGQGGGGGPKGPKCDDDTKPTCADGLVYCAFNQVLEAEDGTPYKCDDVDGEQVKAGCYDEAELFTFPLYCDVDGVLTLTFEENDFPGGGDGGSKGPCEEGEIKLCDDGSEPTYEERRRGPGGGRGGGRGRGGGHGGSGGGNGKTCADGSEPTCQIQMTDSPTTSPTTSPTEAPTAFELVPIEQIPSTSLLNVEG